MKNAENAKIFIQMIKENVNHVMKDFIYLMIQKIKVNVILVLLHVFLVMEMQQHQFVHHVNKIIYYLKENSK